ncbi:hypothetical protein FD722_17515 [Photobacterium damselae subsp. damselae]|uniref:glycosyltransferase family 52 n=1 Tax=Photobacterium damselae TaxID=38293 RepID=UPI0010FE5DDB|nr:glycosyltransferase family 52 [Photobacterium damselae]TLS80844.1 hypothetical protein FD719_17530 [Photobacterium damselae subsp. damselae]TLS87217.1 hypothetical protein FD722_17515 [Photobacterium damselae subsp. damselae]
MSIIIEEKITREYTKVMLTESLYSLALYIFINHNIVDDTLFLLGNNFNIDRVKSKLNNFIIYDHDETKKISKFKRILLANKIVKGEFRYILKLIKDKRLYGHDHLPISPLFFNMNMTLIEDGTSNYIEPEKLPRYKTNLYSFFRTQAYFRGYDKNTKEVFLTDKGKVNNLLVGKTKLIDFRLFLNNINIMLDGSFCPNFKVKDRTILLVTQPLSEDYILDEIEKISIYRKIIDDYKDRNIIIKPHPREKTNYKDIFPQCTIANNSFLVEALLLDDNISEVVTLFSTAIEMNYKKGRKIIKLGTLDNSKLINKFGAIKKREIR